MQASIFDKSLSGISFKSFQTELLKKILYSAIFFKPLYDLFITNQGFIGSFFKCIEVFKIFRE